MEETWIFRAALHIQLPNEFNWRTSMRRQCHDAGEISAKLQHADRLATDGLTRKQAAQAIGVAPATLARWMHKYKGASTEQIAYIKTLQHENKRLRRALAEYALLNDVAERRGAQQR